VTEAAPILIIGASAAGVSAARTLRANAFDGPIVLIDADANPPYERPPLSKQVLQDPASVCEDFALLTVAQAQALGVQLRLGETVTALCAKTLSVTLDSGERLLASAILIATGGRARRLPVPGAELAGVHVIRTFADAHALRMEVAQANVVAVVGGGLIGAEAAATIARAGRRVVWIDGAAKPLVHIFPDAVADHLIASHLGAGLTLRAGVGLDRLLEADGRVCGLQLQDGEVIAADVVVLGVGMAPNDSLARAAGLEVSVGVHVDGRQATSAAHIFAAGDVAAVVDEVTGQRRRHEHWRAAQEQGANAARAMLGLAVLPPAVPWFWSDQGPHHVEMAGRRTGDCVARLGGKGPIVFEMEDGRVVGVASVDEPNAVRVGLRLIQSGRPVERAMLANAAIDLRVLLKVAS
jgi:3-phenylpropionate/trans-cinnamate dioxygenase ferredoxin reductase subunit